MALLLAIAMLFSQFSTGITAFAADTGESASAAGSGNTAETQAIGNEISISGSIVFMDDQSSDAVSGRVTPDIRLYADGTESDVNAEISAASSSYKGLGFTTETFTFSNLAVADSAGNTISYSIKDSNSASTTSYTRYYLSRDTGEVLNPDANGAVAGDGAALVYVQRGDLSGAFSFAGEAVSADNVSLAASSDYNSDLDGKETSSVRYDESAGAGSWTMSHMPLYDPLTGQAIQWKITASDLDGYQTTYDNSMVSGYANVTDGALNGGAILETRIETPTSTETASAETASPESDEPGAMMTMGALLNVTGLSVTNTTYNYASGDTTGYKVSKDATITYGGATISAKANEVFQIPANTTFQIAFNSETDDITVTLSDTAKTVIGANSTVLSLDKKSAEFKSEEANASVTLHALWQDGGATDKPSISLYLQYSKDNGKNWTTISSENIASLGLSAVPAVPERAAGSTSNDWSFNFTKVLNDYAADGSAVIYRLAEQAAPEGYAYAYTGTSSNQLLNAKLNPFSATKSWEDAGNAYKTRLTAAEYIASLTCYKTSLKAGKSQVTLTTTDPTAEGYITVTDNGDNTWTINMPNARAYDTDNFAYSYYLTAPTSLNVEKGADVTANTVYKQKYTNTGNYASLTDALYQDGNSKSTLSDTTVFNATKKWEDDGKPETINARPDASVTLYRYALIDDTADYTSASPVPGATMTLDKTAASGTAIAIQLPASTAAEKLPVYNENGYKYVYYAKETLTYGTGNNEYKEAFVNNGALNGSDKLLFNGGEMDNTITGTVALKVTETWNAAARQTIDAEVLLTLSQTDPDTGETVTYGDPAKLTGFGAEIPSKTANFAGMPEYNAQGHRYTYSVAVTGMKTMVGGALEPCTSKVVSENGTNVQYYITQDGYRYREDKTTDANGNITYTNTLVGNAKVEIDKTFPNGLLASPTSLTYTIYQNGTEIGTKTVSYQNESAVPFTPAAITITSFEDLTTKTTTAAGLLPRYDKSGTQYVYTVQETGITPTGVYGTTTNHALSEGTYAADDANYANEKYALAATSVSNYKPDEGMSITVYDKWNDAGDTLYHEDVAVELQYTADGTTWTTVNSGTISVGSDYVYIGVPKTVPAGSTGTSTYRDLYKAWVAAGKPAAAAGSFRVVETKLGNHAVDDPAVVLSQHPEHVSGSFVVGSNQNYDVSAPAAVTSDYAFTVTNTRVGVEKIILTKDWTDGQNSGATRPDSITFTLTAGEKVFDNNTSDTMTITLSAAAGSAAGDPWTYTTGWLVKYDSAGNIIDYSVEETALNYTTDKTKEKYADLYAKSAADPVYVIGTNHTGDTDTLAFHNVLSGSVKPLMNKYWKDLGDEAAIAARPDIYPVLIRSYKDAAGTIHYEKMTYQDRDWDTITISADWWQCAFVDQDRFTKDGYEYTYYIGEEYTSKTHGDYQCSGGYTDAPAEDGSFTENEANLVQLPAADTGLSKNYYVAPFNNDTGAGGTIVNKLSAKRFISGVKVWDSLPKSFGVSNLPDVTFQLYRYLGDGKQTEADAVAVTDTNNANLTTILKAGLSDFVFGSEVERYDNNGIPYVYVVKETAPENMKLAYEISNDTSSGLLVTNTYKNDQNYGVTFTKNWSGIPAGSTLKPGATLTLSRYLTDKDGNVISGTKESDFADAVTNTNANTLTIDSDTTEVKWSSLAYYAPNRNPYHYVVAESSVSDGYVVYDAAGTTKVNNTQDSGYEAVVTGTYATLQGTAGLTNKYGEVLGKLKITKSWIGDSSYGVNARPGSILVNLYRASDSVKKELVQENISIKSTDNWEKTIEGLEVYAVNGEPYTYTVEEVGTLSGYSLTITPVGVTLDTTATKTATLANTASTTSVSASKIWKNSVSNAAMDKAALLFNSKLDGVGASVVCHFEYSIDGGTSWTVLNDTSGNPVTQTIKQSADGSFSAVSLSSLPTFINDAFGVAKAASYRAYEYSITYADGTTYTRTDTPAQAADSSAIQTISVSGSTSGNATTITNTVRLKKITITKRWDDEYNRDGKRPSSVSFTVTRTNVEKSGTNADTASATVTLTAANKTDDNTWTADYYVPVYWNQNTTVQSSYAVTETAVSSYAATVSADNNTYATDANNKLELGVSGTSAYFKNSETHETYTIQPAKEWRYNGAVIDLTSEANAWYRAYLPASLTFTLQASVVDKSGKTVTDWADLDSAAFGSDFTGQTKTRTAAVNQTTGAITVTNWVNLPKYAYDTTVTNLLTYRYRLVETQNTTEANCFTASCSPSYVVGTVGKTSTLTVQNALSRATLTVSKTWEDGNNVYASRPSSIRFTVQRKLATEADTAWADYNPSGTEGGVVTFTATVNADGTLTGAAYGALPKYAADGTTLYQYRAVESALIYGTKEVTPGETSIYSVSPASGTSFTNTMLTTSVTATKTWVDESNKYGLRPASITFKVQSGSDGATWTDYNPTGAKVVTFTADVDLTTGALTNNTLSGLPRVDTDGNAIWYRAVENSFTFADKSTAPRDGSTIGDYEASEGAVTGNGADGYTTPVTNTTETGAISLSKSWADDNNRDNARPTSVTISLTASVNGNAIALPDNVAATATLTGAGWSDDTTWAKVPVKDKDGNTITYTLTETVPTGYTASKALNGGTFSDGASVSSAITRNATTAAAFTNTRVYDTQTVTATKTWSDNSAYGDRPSSVTYTLWAKYTDANGAEQSYQVAKNNSGTAVTNPVTVSGAYNAANWTTSWTDMPKYQTGQVGKTITYTITEASVGNGYTAAYSENHLTVTNTMKTTTLEVEKQWAGTDVFDYGSKIASVTFKLTRAAAGSDEYADVVDANGDMVTLVVDKSTDTGSFTDLPTYASDGVTQYQYRAVELGFTMEDSTWVTAAYGDDETSGTVGAYTYTSSTGNGKTTAVNTLRVTSVTAAKHWIDADNSGGTRPDTVTLRLLLSEDGADANEVAGQEKTLTNQKAATTDTSVTWSNLPVCDITGETGYAYSISEDPMDGYISALSGDELTGFTVTNKATTVTLRKAGTAGDLAGATFEVTPADNNTFADGTKAAKTLLSGQTSGTLVGQLKVNTPYVFRETVTPSGYITMDSFRVTLDDMGNVSVTGTEAEVAEDQVTITATNTQNRLTVEKEGNGQTVAGASFSLLSDEDQTVADSWTIQDADPTENPREITGKMTAGVVYKLTETGVPAGYTKAADLYLRMSADGQLYSDTSADGEFAGAVQDNAVIVSDTLNTITLCKTDENGEPLTGATFTVTPEAGKSFADGTTEPKTILNEVLDEETWEGQLTAGTVYTFTETTSPSAYVTMAPFTIQIDEAGVVTAAGTGVTVGKDHVTVTAKNSPMTAAMTLTKVDADDSARKIQGAVFTLTGYTDDGTSFDTRTLTTGADGVITTSGLPKGQYELAETETDENYENDYFMASFNVTDACQDQTLSINAGSLGKATPFGLTIEQAPEDLSAGGVKNARKTGTVDIEKLGKDGDPLEGATFELRTSDGVKVTDGVTAPDGMLRFENLTWGSYYLVETGVPDGYILDSATHHEFTIGYGALSKSFTDASAIQNTRNTFTLLKQDEAGTGIAGAAFTVEGFFSDSNGVSVSKEITNQETNWIGLMIGGYSYAITETLPPAGYKAAATFTVRMETDGTLSTEDEQLPEGVSIKGHTVTVQDQKNTFSVTKNGQNDQSLAGAKFELRVASTNVLTDSWTITEAENNPFTIEGKLTAGTVYRLTETAPAPGYTNAAPVYLRMDIYGNLEESDAAEGDFEPVENNALEILDTLNEATIASIDYNDGSNVSGTGLRLAGTFADGTSDPITWSSGTEAYDLLGKLTAGNEYKLSQTSPAAGYKLLPITDSYPDAVLSEGAMTLRMDNDGQLWYSSSADGGWSMITYNAVEILTDKNDITVVKKAAEDNTALTGATFMITPADGSAFADGGTEAKVLLSDSVSDLYGQLVAGNTYTIQETVPPLGYKTAPEFTIKVSADGASVTLNGETIRGDITIDAMELTVKDSLNSVTLKKTDKDANALTGAKFTITGLFTDSQGKETRDLLTSGSEGTVTGQLVAGRSYTISETAIPAGYIQTPDFEITMNADGTVALTGEPAGISVNGAVITAVNTANSFTFTKVDEKKAELKGATFTLTGTFADGTESVTLLSGEASEILTKQMIAGNTYTLAETTAPAGQLAIDPVKLTCASDGTIALAEGETTTKVTIDETGRMVTIQDDPTAILFQKTDRTTGVQLPNHLACIFTVTPVDTTFADGSSDPITGNDDTLTQKLRGMLRTSSGNNKNVYSIKEIQEPGGYQIEPEAVNFIVDETGKLYALNGEGTIVTSAEGVTGLSFSDPTIKVSFSKTDADGNPLAGAAMEIDGTFADGAASKTFTSEEAPYVLDKLLIAGQQYTLKEISAPDGYKTLDADVIFTVDSLGKVTLVNDADGAATLSEDRNTIQVRDTRKAVATNGTKTKDEAKPEAYAALLAFAAGTLLITWKKRKAYR